MTTRVATLAGAEPRNREAAQGLLVSIITPSLNQGEFIVDAIRSVEEQTYPRIEHIVVDGGSTDSTLDVLCRSEREHFIWQSEPDEGQAHAIQKGFALARGEIFAWLNADDMYLDSNVIDRVVEVFHHRVDADLVTGGGLYLSERGDPVRAIHPPTAVTYERLRRSDPILQPATFFWRAVAETLPLDCSLVYAFDWDFFVRAAERYTIEVIPEALAGYRMYGRNKTAAGGSRRTAEIAEITGRYLGRRSWQYATFRFAASVDRLVDRLPPAPRRFLRRCLYRGLMGAVFRLSIGGIKP